MKKKEKNRVVAFTIADENNMAYYNKLEKSFHKFHPDIELVVVTGEQLRKLLEQDKQFFYRATPVIAWNLFKTDKYDTVVKIDADSIITGDISHTWEGDFDVAVVNNSNPREMATYPVSVWNIHPLSYVNAGFVVMKSRNFVVHWLGLCTSPHFEHYQMREQDLLNIMCFYMNNTLGGTYNVRFLDSEKYAHGLVVKGYWADMIMKKDELILPKNEEWNSEDKIVKVLHWAGGNTPNKQNFDLQFQDEVSTWLKELIK